MSDGTTASSSDPVTHCTHPAIALLRSWRNEDPEQQHADWETLKREIAMDEPVTTVLPDKRLIWLLARYQVTMTCKAQSWGTCEATRYTNINYSATVIAENEGRKLTGVSWARSAEAALDEALAEVVRQVEALDALK